MLRVTRRLRCCALTVALLAGSLAQARPFTDSAGRTVDAPDTIQRVYPAGHPATILVYTLAPEMLAGWTRPPQGAAREFIPEAYRNLPELGRLSGRGDTASREAVLLAKPDLILDYGAVSPTYVDLANRVQSQLGIPYVLLDGSFARIPQTYRRLGDLLGRKERAEALAVYAERTVAEARAAIAAIPAAEQPRVYYGRGPDGLQTGLPGSINVELLDLVGVHNVAAESGRGRLSPVSLEQVLRWNPEVILTIDRHFADAVRKDPRWEPVAAVRAQRVYLAPDLPFGWFDQPPSVNRLIGIRWLLHTMYGKPTEAELAADAREFYRRFYHVKLTDPQIAVILASTAGR